MKALFNSLCYLIWLYLFQNFVFVWGSFSKTKKSAHDNKRELFSRKGNKYFLNCYIYFHLKILEVALWGIT